VRDFTVKSSIHDYKVKFVESAGVALVGELIEGDSIIVDSRIRELYPDLLDGLEERHTVLSIDADEQHKSYQGLVVVLQKLIDSGFRKNHRLIGIGGGITQDIAGFISSIIYRGVDWMYFPTTLLAQGDSCIGSKTSVNFGPYKNQLGGFYPPNMVFIDPRFLDSLNRIDLQSGLGEMCHYFVISGEKDFKWFGREYDAAFADKSKLREMVARSLSLKKQYIEIDEFDRRERQIFNYGHSFGHAIETLSQYEIPHGIAVSFGMDIANYLSTKMGSLPGETRLEIRQLLSQIWQGFSIRDIELGDLLDALYKDKKNVGKQLTLVLCEGYGKVFRRAFEVDEWLVRQLNGYLKDET